MEEEIMHNFPVSLNDIGKPSLLFLFFLLASWNAHLIAGHGTRYNVLDYERDLETQAMQAQQQDQRSFYLPPLWET